MQRKRDDYPLSELAELVFAENKRIVLLSIFNDKSFVTPKVMSHVKNRTSLPIHLIDKMAMIGLSPTEKVILKGYNLIFKRDLKHSTHVGKLLLTCWTKLSNSNIDWNIVLSSLIRLTKQN